MLRCPYAIAPLSRLVDKLEQLLRKHLATGTVVIATVVMTTALLIH